MFAALLTPFVTAGSGICAISAACCLCTQADSSNRGYHPYGMGTAKNPYKQLDRKEAWNGYLGWEDDAVDRPFRGRNRWPDEQQLPGFRPAMTAYYHAMSGVADRRALGSQPEKLPFQGVGCSLQIMHPGTMAWKLIGRLPVGQ